MFRGSLYKHSFDCTSPDAKRSGLNQPPLRLNTEIKQTVEARVVSANVGFFPHREKFLQYSVSSQADQGAKKLGYAWG